MPSLSKLETWAALLLAANLAARLLGLGTAPPAFSSEEARAAAHALCVAQTGADMTGRRLPAFSPDDGTLRTTSQGGLHNAPWIVPAALWSKVFGPSPAAFRAFSSAMAALAVPLVFLLARRLAGPAAALWAALAFAFMPGSFHLGRLAWDSALVPMLIAAGTLAFLDGRRPALALSGAFFALACWAYPGPRLQLPLLLAALLWLRPLKRAEAGVFLGALLLAGAPVLHGLLDGFLLRRYQDVTIFRADIYAPGGVLALKQAWRFLSNLGSHFSPAFLFLKGDANLRHSAGVAGLLGPLDALGLLWALWSWTAGGRKPGRLDAFCAAAVFSGFLPSMVTQEAPHALRCLGALPFVSLWTGTQLAQAAARLPRAARPALAALAAWAAFFLHGYFTRYPAMAAGAFEAGLGDQAPRAGRRWEPYVSGPELERLARAYFVMAGGAAGCAELRGAVKDGE